MIVRTCPKCALLFQAAPTTTEPCPRCRTRTWRWHWMPDRPGLPRNPPADDALTDDELDALLYGYPFHVERAGLQAVPGAMLSPAPGGQHDK